MTTRHGKLVVSFHHNKACHIIIICLVASLFFLENLLNKIFYFFSQEKKNEMTTSYFSSKKQSQVILFYYFFDDILSCKQFSMFSRSLSNYLHINHANKQKTVVCSRVHCQSMSQFPIFQQSQLQFTLAFSSSSLSLSFYSMFTSLEKANKSSSSMNCRDFAVENEINDKNQYTLV